MKRIRFHIIIYLFHKCEDFSTSVLRVQVHTTETVTSEKTSVTLLDNTER
jgi:hypothetical protein